MEVVGGKLKEMPGKLAEKSGRVGGRLYFGHNYTLQINEVEASAALCSGTEKNNNRGENDIATEMTVSIGAGLVIASCTEMER